MSKPLARQPSSPAAARSAPEAKPAGDGGELVHVGDWYWVRSSDEDEIAISYEDLPEDTGEAKRWFGCVVHLGSNYAQVEGPLGRSSRVHFDDFLRRCRRELAPDAIIDAELARRREAVGALMGEVRALTARLAVGPTPELASGETQTGALVLRMEGRSFSDYSTELERAKDKELPALFRHIKEETALLARWMSAHTIPLTAEAKKLEKAIGEIGARIFEVELYAGLVEQMERIADGPAAEIGEKLHLLQRRCYMDEECLAAFDDGGMDIRSLEAFDSWLSEPRHRDRILPFPRSIVSFRVRRFDKARFHGDLRGLIENMELEEADKLTFLYIRNGERIHRMRTRIDFGAQLFPDMSEAAFESEELWASVESDGRVRHIMSGRQRVDELERREKRRLEIEAMPEGHAREWAERDLEIEAIDPYVRCEPGTIYYDDIRAHLAKQMQAHNRIALVIQGLLDRSPCLHPHPPWQIWTQAGFNAALELVYDETRALTTGEPPDFEAYRAKLNASLAPGSVTVGQEIVWEEQEAVKENERDHSQYRRGRRRYPERTLDRYRPYGDPGPGRLAVVASVVTRGKGGTRARFAWQKERDNRFGDPLAPRHRTCDVPVSRLLHVGAYKPGDFHLFFDDPRTRANYLEWAPLLLVAEAYHMGKLEAPKPPPGKPEPTPREPGGSYDYQKRKRLLALDGKAVRLLRTITTNGGRRYDKGELFRASKQRGDSFSLAGITADGRNEYDRDPESGDGFCLLRHIGGVESRHFVVDERVPPEPKAPPARTGGIASLANEFEEGEEGAEGTDGATRDEND